MQFFEKVVNFIDMMSEKTGYIIGWICTLMVLVVFYDTIMRYALLHFKKKHTSELN